jgi:hypothetical protein
MVVLKFRLKKLTPSCLTSSGKRSWCLSYSRGSTLSIRKYRVTFIVLIYFLRKTYINASGAPREPTNIIAHHISRHSNLATSSTMASRISGIILEGTCSHRSCVSLRLDLWRLLWHRAAALIWWMDGICCIMLAGTRTTDHHTTGTIISSGSPSPATVSCEMMDRGLVPKLTTHQSTIRIIRIDRIHESGIKWVCQNILPADRLNNTVTYTFNTSSKCSEVKLLLSTSLLNKLKDGENPRVKFNDIVWHLVSATAFDFGDEHVHED